MPDGGKKMNPWIAHIKETQKKLGSVSYKVAMEHVRGVKTYNPSSLLLKLTLLLGHI